VIDANAVCFARLNKGRSKQKTCGHAATRPECQKRRHDSSDDATARFGQAELGGGRSYDNVTGKYQAGASGNRRAIHRGNDRLRKLDHLSDEFAIGLGSLTPFLVLLFVWQFGRGKHLV
jgi:hypothetical protein